MDANCRLVAYGTLAPGQPNHSQLAGLQGHWLQGHVTGRLVPTGWGASLGYPALVLDSEGAEIEVQICESVDLPHHCPRLDDFEGWEYQRVVTTVRTALGEIDASIYVSMAPDPDTSLSWH